ncbi:MAG: CCA tRNA nucleotidyltransferase [Magnetococcales bacterium]|nr:CCA tRNA nucleotidyltransferase [Magnetococcales bacterium]
MNNGNMIPSLNNSLPPFLQTLLDDLHHLIGPIYLVGGAVRNGLQGKPPTNDLNILVARSLAECRKMLNEGGYSPGMASSRHNVLFLPLKGCERPKTVEISTFRHRPSQSPSVEEDLLQRDITVNAMAYLWPNGPVIDPFNGQEDLTNRKTRLVNGATTLIDDPLRALRFFRFSLQLSSDPESVDLARSSETLLNNVMPDRIRVELDRIFSFPLRTEPTQKLFIYLLNSTLGKNLLPELALLKSVRDKSNPQRTVWQRTIQTILSLSTIPPDEDLSLLELRWSALLIGISSTCSETEQLFSSDGLKSSQEESSFCCKQILEKFCFSKRRQRRIINLLQHLNLDSDPSDRVLKRLLNDSVPLEGLYRIHHAWNQAGLTDQSPNSLERRRQEEQTLQLILDRCRGIRRSKFRPRANDLAISGGDILNLVRKPPGPWLGKLQHQLVDCINDDPSLNRPEILNKKILEWILTQDSL